MDLDTFLTTLYVMIDDWYKREMSFFRPDEAACRSRLANE